jgi:hypothetical protein
VLLRADQVIEERVLDPRGRLLMAALGFAGSTLLAGCSGGPIAGPPVITDPDHIRSPFDGLTTMTLTIDGARAGRAR